MKLHARLLAVAFAMISMPAWTQLYQITDLGSLGGNAISPTSVNDNAQVTGSGTTAFSNFTQAFFYSNGQLRNISPLGSTQSVAVAINSRGKITGTFIDSNSGHRAFLYDTTSGQMQDIGEHPGEWGEGRGINDSGQITGYALEQNGVHPYIYSQGTLHFLGALGNSGSAGYAINASGQITGSSTSPGGSRTFIYDFNSGVTQDLGTLGGTGSNGNDINDSGQVTGMTLIFLTPRLSMMTLEVQDGKAIIYDGVQARGGQAGSRTRHDGEPGVEGSRPARERASGLGQGCQSQRPQRVSGSWQAAA